MGRPEGTKLTVPAKPFTAPMGTVYVAGPLATTGAVNGNKAHGEIADKGHQRPCSHQRPAEETSGVIDGEGLHHVSSLPLALRV